MCSFFFLETYVVNLNLTNAEQRVNVLNKTMNGSSPVAALFCCPRKDTPVSRRCPGSSCFKQGALISKRNVGGTLAVCQRLICQYIPLVDPIVLVLTLSVDKIYSGRFPKSVSNQIGVISSKMNYFKATSFLIVYILFILFKRTAIKQSRKA